jgi:hypothetical protein
LEARGFRSSSVSLEDKKSIAHENNMKKSKEAEALFEKFLNKNKIPYYYISQYQEKYSED